MKLEFTPGYGEELQNYCIYCQFKFESSSLIKNIYDCRKCGKSSDRAIVIDPQTTWWVDREATYWHESVGAIIFDKNGRILLFQRTQFPPLITLPAGHLDFGESAENAIKREVHEEVGLVIKNFTLITREEVRGDSCRRGCDDHIWNLYCAILPEDAVVRLNHEGSKVLWLTQKEALTKKITVPTRYFLEKYLQISPIPFEKKEV